MQMDLRSLRRPFHLILDWDGTITKKDTLALVGQAAYQHHALAEPKDSPALPPWSDFAEAWLNDFSTHQSSYSPTSKDRSTIEEERAWLASLSDIESRSVSRVESSNLFKGVTTADVHLAVKTALKSGEMQLRPGWLSLFRKTRGASVQGHLALSFVASPPSSSSPQASRLSILSVNWSKLFIRAALRCAIKQALHPDYSSDGGNTAPISFDPLDSYVLSMEVLANEISGLMDESGSDGSLSKNGARGIRTAGDKLAHFPERCRRKLDPLGSQSEQQIPVERTTSAAAEATTANAHGHDSPPVIYVGDSATDFEALLAADIGICIRDDPMGSGQRELADMFERVGVVVLHVTESPPPPSPPAVGAAGAAGAAAAAAGDGVLEERNDGKTIIYWARDLQEVANVLPDQQS